MATTNIVKEKNAATGEKKESLIKRILGMRETMLFMIILVFCVILAVSSPAFGTWLNIKTLLVSMATTGMVVIAMTIVMVTGGIDLSVGSLMCLTMGIAALLFKNGMNPWIASLIGIGASVFVGWIQGMIITKIKLIHFIVTMCFMGIARGFVMWISGGTPISLVTPLTTAPVFTKLGQSDVLGGIPLPIIIFIVITVFADFMMRKSSSMRQLFYTGSNEKAAAYSGIKTDRVKIAAMMMSGFFCGIAGIIYMVRFSGVPMSAGQGYEMTAIASCVIGGCSMNGGRGTIFGAMLGLAFMTLVTNALNLFLVTPTIQDLIRYIIVLAAVILDNAQQNAQQRKLA